MTYLRLTGHPAGLLINFNEVTLRAGLKRLDHPQPGHAKRLETDPKCNAQIHSEPLILLISCSVSS